MNYDHILIRYGEISTKGKNRKRFVDQLKENIKLVLHEFPALVYSSNRDRMYIRLQGENHEPILEKLENVFGIHSFSLALKTKNELDAIKDGALELMSEQYKPGDTFKISMRPI